MTWIRVDLTMPANHKIGAFHNRMPRQPFALTVGQLVLVWLWIGREHWDGNLADAPNEEIEHAARWNGEPDTFALAFRDVFCDKQGRVKAWLKRQGKLIEYNRKNARRMRERRGLC